MRTSSNSSVLGVSPSESPATKHPAAFMHASSFVAAAYLSRGICALRAFINARWLGPEIYGFFGTLSFITSFAYQLHLGTVEVMVKEMPGLLRRQKIQDAENLAHITFTFYLSMLLFACAAMWLYAFNLPESTPSYIRIGWLAGSLILALEVFFDFQQTLACAKQQFRIISLGLLAANTISFILTFWLVRNYQFYGYLTVAFLTPLLGLIFLSKAAGYRWKLVWSTPKITAMVRTGFSILTMTLVFKAVWWIDRILVLHYAGSHGFGYYLLGTMVAQICFLFPEVIASIIEPKIHYDYAADQNPEHIRRHLNSALQALSYLMPLGFLILDGIVPYLLKTALPQYMPAISCIRILIWGSLLMGFSACSKAFMVALGKQTRVLWIYGAAILSNLIAGIILGNKGLGIEGIAAATLIGYFVCSSGILAYAYHSLGDRPTSAFRQIALLFVYPLIAAFFGILIPEYLQFKNAPHSSVLIFRCASIFIYAIFILREAEKKVGLRQLISLFHNKKIAEMTAGATAC